MKVDLFAVFDRCSGVYDGPFGGRADAEMIRNFRFMCTNEESQAPIIFPTTHLYNA